MCHGHSMSTLTNSDITDTNGCNDMNVETVPKKGICN